MWLLRRKGIFDRINRINRKKQIQDYLYPKLVSNLLTNLDRPTTKGMLYEVILLSQP